MDLSLNRDQLLNALGVVHRIVPKKTTIPVLQNILLDAGPLTITGTDCDMMGTVVLEGQVGASTQRITVPGHTLHDIVRKLPAGSTVNASLGEPGGPLMVKCGRSDSRYRHCPPKTFRISASER